MTDLVYRRVRAGLAAGSIVVLLCSGSVLADPPQDPPEPEPGVMVSPPVTPYRFDGAARDLPAPRRWKPGDPVREIPRRAYAKPGQKKDISRAAGQGVDPLLELQRTLGGGATTRAFDAPDRNFDGQGFSGVNPPDTVGDVGPNHYVQMINDGAGATVRIHDKAQPTPAVLADFTLDSLGSGSCAGGLGDPIVLYDRFADRWLLTEFSSSGNNLCMYVSQTPDPTGSYFAYAFTAPQFPDYPKYGVWPTDANGGQGSYIVTTNESGSGVYAMDRAAMLAGAAATFQRFVISDLPGFSFNAVTPADLDGPNPPPSGAPAVIMRQRDTEVHSGPTVGEPADVIEMWHYDVDWVTPANTTLTQLSNVLVTDFESDLCGLTAFACFPQPGSSTTLDPLREVVMNRLQYFNFNDHEKLVGNFVTDVDGTDHGGLRWFEMRRVGGAASPWTLHQEGTYAPDASHRWMAASAMDQSGNFAIAYNISDSSAVFPGLRYTGRLADDTLGVLTQPETVIVSGSAANSSNRYGDYSGMNLDPEDDCTFWFTGEYNPSSNWSTRIASFRFDACGCDLFPSPLSISGGVGGPNQVDLSWNDSDLPEVIEYRVMRSRTSGGPYTVIDVVADTSPMVPNSGAYNYSDTTVSGGIDYYYVVRASDGGACTSEPSNELAVTATGVCTLPPLFAGLETVETPNNGICTLNLTWSAATPECAGPITYTIYRSDTASFVPLPANELSTTTGTSYSDIDLLISGEDYFYIVRATDDSNASTETNTVEIGAVPAGTIQPPVFSDDGGDTGPAQLIPSGPWTNAGSGGNFGPGVYTTNDYGNNTCADIVTPSFQLGIGNMLTFWSTYDIENSWDKGEVQISSDGGVNWTRVEVGYPGTSTNTSDQCGLGTGTYFTGTDSNWNQYVGDLSPWDGQTVQIRWTISTDGSVTRTIGWVIDDIVVGNGAAACATASACADNPIVDVTPDGPLTECSLSLPQLSANLSGGVPPFTYQWYEDGLPIGGETGSTYQPNGSGTHTYNVRVQAQTCPDEVSDGQGTTITSVSTPQFAGVVSATDRGESTCGIDVTWNTGSSVCPGPIVYDVYRSTSSPVDPMTATPVASGIGGTSLADSVGLMFGNTYHYLVRATDLSTSATEGNTAEASAAPAGPGGGLQTLFTEDFESGTLAGWTVSTGPGPHTCGPWILVDDSYTANAARPDDSTGFYALTDSDECGSGSTTSTSLDSPVVDTLIPNAVSVMLNLNMYYNHHNGDDATIEVWDGAAWQVVWADSDADFNGAQSIDVTAHANANFQVRFNYQNAAFDWWFAVDNVEIVADVAIACATGTAGPPPAPDGSAGTAPLRAENLADGTGDTLQISWDASCAATDYNLIFGDLSNVSTLALAGSECSIGTSGSHTWNSVPGGNLFFLVVGSDGAGIESSWGSTSAGAERNGGLASGECGASAKDVTGTCP